MEKLCRAKAIETGEMVYGFYVKHIYSDTTRRPKERGYIGYITDEGSNFVEVDPTTRQMYVGRDNFGNLLYEGDTVKIYALEYGEEKVYETGNIVYAPDYYGYLPMCRHINGYHLGIIVELIQKN